ncbi:MAG: M15 family metallopeptidase [Bacilli bacterium]|nr:M15 family metallopeptidase [Bacilli bacterium]
MARRRKRRLKRKVKVTFFIFLLIILIGGISIYMLSQKNKSSSSKEVKKEQKTKKEEIIKEVNKESNLKEAPKNSSEYLAFGDGEYKTDKGFTIKIENGIASVEGNIIVNKTYSLPKEFRPTNPYSNSDKDWAVEMIDKDATNSFKLMQSDAKALGLNIYIASGFRGYSSQERIYNNYVAQDGKEAADTYSARPGFSEHQSGLCFDLNSVNDSFTNTNEGKWINNNAHLYGFIIRFPKGKEKETGYQYESWHLRYVDKDLAKKLYNNGDWISLEEYYGLSSNY